MRSLFLKIFLWFWATAILTGIALVLTFVWHHSDVPAQWHTMFEDAGRFSGGLAVRAFEQQGAPGAAAYVRRLQQDTHLQACLFDQSGDAVAGEACSTFEDTVARVAASGNTAFGFKYGLVRVGLILSGSSGHRYIFATELPAGPRAIAAGISGSTIALRWGIAFLVSGFVCYLLTRYITAPVVQLRQASRQLAAGALGSRAAAGMERRGDELGGLVRDFNSMADRIEHLIASQRQLLYDVSHEVRSPLARLGVALDLARERKGEDPAFEHMQQDIERLDQAMERLLTIARLDTSAAPVPMSPLDLNGLVAQVVKDARFEMQGRGRSIEFAADQECQVVGNAKLLHTAIENVIRNAIRHSSSDVEVWLQPTEEAGMPRVLLQIRDHGHGVPQEELQNIFRPFYRVADARDTGSGGTGLGLAIAERVIRLHAGRIWAENAAGNGLCVSIVLPVAATSQAGQEKS